MKPSSTEKPVASTPKTPDGAVAVGEVAALRRAAPHEQHRRDGDGRRTDDDQDAPDEVHALCETIGVPRRRLLAAALATSAISATTLLAGSGGAALAPGGRARPPARSR